MNSFFFHFQSVKPCSNLKKINDNNLKAQCDFPKIIGTFLDSFWFLGIFRYERRPTSLLLFLLVAAASPLAFLAWNGGVLWHFFWKLLEKDPQLIIREWNLFQKIKQHTHIHNVVQPWGHSCILLCLQIHRIREISLLFSFRLGSIFSCNSH